jgi:hypothetical protein
MIRMLSPFADRHVHEAPLGIVFADPLEDRAISDGLRVELAEPTRPQRKQRLAANGRGVFAAHSLPRFRRSRTGETRPFLLTVEDALARYLPFRLTLQLPGHGLIDLDNAGSPSESDPFVPLYSAPSRSFSSTLGALRTSLRVNADRPASWAFLELSHGAVLLAQGAADGAGNALLVFGLPSPVEPALGVSPLEVERSWDVSLRVYWDPMATHHASPDLRTLRSQPAVVSLPSEFVLRAGETLIAHSPGSSFLFVNA